MAINPIQPIDVNDPIKKIQEGADNARKIANELNDSLKNVAKTLKEAAEIKIGGNLEEQLLSWGKLLKKYEAAGKKSDELEKSIQKQSNTLVQNLGVNQQLVDQINNQADARRKLGEETNKIAEYQNKLRDAEISGDATRIQNAKNSLKAQVDQVKSLEQQLSTYDELFEKNSSLIQQYGIETVEKLRQLAIDIQQKEVHDDYLKNHEREYQILQVILDEKQKELAAELAKNDEEEKAINKLKQKNYAYKLIDSTVKSISNSLGLGKITIAGIVEKVFELDKLYTNNAKQLGVSRDLTESIAQSTSTAAAAEGSIAASGNTIVQTQKNILEAQSQLNAELGTANFFTQERLKDQASLVKEMGLEASIAAKLQVLSLVSGAKNREIIKSVNESVIALRNKTGIELDNKKVLEDVVKVSGQLAVQYKNNPELLAKAVVQAKALGLTLEQTAGMADKLLNFESSIESELKAELLTGKALNLEQARYLALTGDSAGAAKELMNQIGGIQEYENMNVIQRRAYAEALGMSADELANSLKTQKAASQMGLEDAKALNEMRAEYIKQGKEEEFNKEMRRRGVADDVIVAQQQLGAQEKMNLLIDKMLEMFSNLAEPLTNIINFMTGLISKAETFKKIMGAVAGIIATKIVISLVMAVDSLKKAQIATTTLQGVQVLLGNVLGINALKAQATAAAGTAGLSLGWTLAAVGGLAAALGIGGYALMGGFSSGGESIDTSSTTRGNMGTSSTNRSATPQNQPPIVVHSYLQVNGQTGQVWKDELNKSDSTGKVA